VAEPEQPERQEDQRQEHDVTAREDEQEHGNGKTDGEEPHRLVNCRAGRS